MRSSHLGYLVLTSVVCAGCSPSSGGGGATNDAGTSPDGGGYGQYQTLHGTFTAPSINATFTGAMIGSYQDSHTTWNAAGSSDIAATNGSPTTLVATGTLPSGDTAAVIINLSNITATPAAGTFNCATDGTYQIDIEFRILPSGSTVPAIEYSSMIGACMITLQEPTIVQESNATSTFQVYFAHGSLTATMGQSIPQGTGNGMMSVTW
jgi:hypothetical protein